MHLYILYAMVTPPDLITGRPVECKYYCLIMFSRPKELKRRLRQKWKVCL